MSHLSQANTILLVTTLALLSCIDETLVSGWALFKFQKYHVIILNGLQPSRDKLEVHCKSRDDDLGLHELALNDEFEWEFRDNFTLSTLFFCGLSWSGGEKVFDAWKDTVEFLDLGCGGRHCIWKAQEDGIYLYNIKEQMFKLYYEWDNVKRNLR